jgi:hypothetical protein
MGIDGHWVGSYFQDFFADPDGLGVENPDNTFPIEAWFEIDGDILKGRMVDLKPGRELPYKELVERNWFELAPEEKQHEESFIANHTDCIFQMRMDTESTLSGQVSGRKVIFTKTYAGPAEYTYIVRGHEQSHTDSGPPIEYVGELSADETVITGIYRFQDMADEAPDPREIQTFVLRRA